MPDPVSLASFDLGWDEPPSLLSQALGLTGTIGVLTGAISALNLMSSVFGLGLNAFWTIVLSFWRNLVHETIFANLFGWLSLDVPERWYDPIALWLILSGLCFRTLLQARQFVRMAEAKLQNDLAKGKPASGRLEIGSLETAAFRWPYATYFVAAFVLCVAALPAVAIRLAFGNMPVYLNWNGKDRGRLVKPSFQVSFRTISRKQDFDYRKIVLVQVAVFLLAFLVLFATNAGLR